MDNNKLLSITFSALICATTCFSQSFQTYIPFQDDSVKTRELLDGVTTSYKRDIHDVTGKNRNYIIDIYKERYENIREDFSTRMIITASEANNYLISLVREITSHNPELAHLTTRVVFSRAWWPNASSMGEGTILFNIGLFNRLRNESQAAFVLCHELAHLYLGHGNKSIERYVNTIYSDEFQKELKEIQKSEYGKGRQIESLSRKITFGSRRHSREHESQADSMAVMWLKNTHFEVRETLSCLALLDSVDKDKYEYPLDLEHRFNFPAFPFQKRWIREDKGLGAMAAEGNDPNSAKELDSLKTHPDCVKRIALLKDLVRTSASVTGSLSPVNETEFRRLRTAFDFEIIASCYAANHISRCLYYCLETLQAYPDNAWLYGMTCRCLNQVYLSQKRHELSKTIDLPGPDAEKRYDSMLVFLQNLHLSEIAALCYYYAGQFQTVYCNDETFLAALIISKDIFNKPEEHQQWIEYYHKKFPNGNYQF